MRSSPSPSEKSHTPPRKPPKATFGASLPFLSFFLLLISSPEGDQAFSRFPRTEPPLDLLLRQEPEFGAFVLHSKENDELYVEFSCMRQSGPYDLTHDYLSRGPNHDMKRTLSLGFIRLSALLVYTEDQSSHWHEIAYIEADLGVKEQTQLMTQQSIFHLLSTEWRDILVMFLILSLVDDQTVITLWESSRVLNLRGCDETAYDMTVQAIG
ncbi:hypothetical protein VNO77_04452 [Canavalia gladiata]|uniref:Uncharacterized protein n=1 Tax=Canavalia gladiata TaxID=3824 RepID=A0AAN9MXC9_CANGL